MHELHSRVRAFATRRGIAREGECPRFAQLRRLASIFLGGKETRENEAGRSPERPGVANLLDSLNISCQLKEKDLYIA